jgi:hypothetical protein
VGRFGGLGSWSHGPIPPFFNRKINPKFWKYPDPVNFTKTPSNFAEIIF